MNMLLRLVGPLMALTILHFLYINIFMGPAITAESGGIQALDLMPTGYSFNDAYAFFSGNAASAGTSFATLHATHDMLFPALYGITFALAIWGLSAGWPKTVRIIVSIVPLFGAIVDYVENAKLIVMIHMDPRNIVENQVTAASDLTETKFILIGISFGIIVVILTRNFIRNSASPKRP